LAFAWENLDFALVVASALFLVAAGSAVFAARLDDMGGTWALFAAFCALYATSMCLAGGVFLPVGLPADVLQGTAELAAYALLAAHALTGVRPGRTVPGLIVLTLGSAAVLAFAAGPHGMLSSFPLTVGTPVMFLGARKLIRQGRSAGPGRAPLGVVAVALAAHALLQAVGVLGDLFTGTQVLAARTHAGQWSAAMGAPRLLAAAVVAFGMIGFERTAVWKTGGSERPAVGGLRSVAAVLGALLFVGLGWLSIHNLGRRGTEDARVGSEARVLTIRLALDLAMDRVDRLAVILAQSPEMVSFLSTRQGAARAAVESTLDRFRDGLGGSVCYLLDDSGVVVATSEPAGELTRIGMPQGGRVHARSALAGATGRHLDRDRATGAPRYYAASPVRDARGDVLGVAVVEQDAAPMRRHLGGAGASYLVTPDGVAFLASPPEHQGLRLWATEGPKASGSALLVSKPTTGDMVWIQGDPSVAATGAVRLPDWSILHLEPATASILRRKIGLALVLGVALLAVALRVVGRMQAFFAHRVADSERFHRTLVETEPNWISIIDATGRVLFCNPAGWHAFEVDEWSIPPEIDALCGEGTMNALGPSLAAKGPAAVELALRRPSGGALWWQLTTVPLSQGTGDQGTYLLIGSDITARKVAEEKLVRSERIAAVGTLAAGIAHQFNNINAVILGWLQVAQLDAGLPERTSSSLKTAEHAVRRSVDITGKLLVLTGPAPESDATVDAAQVMRDLMVALEPQIRTEGTTVTLEAEGPCPVALPRRQVSFILESLLSNARHALLGRKTREIRMQVEAQPDAAVLRVSDTGLGISPDRVAGIFTPFATDKGEHAEPGSPQAAVKGVGLSLAVSDAMVRGRGGHIEVQSEPDRGTTVIVYLPRGA
jgi:C4-dicarboxylate-specific signal transduction histidine kinase